MTVRGASDEGYGARRRTAIRWLRVLGYLVYLLAFVVLVDLLVFWRPMVASLRGLHPEDLVPPRYVDLDTLRRLGTLRADRTSSFPHFAEHKREGVARLCAYGDSFTYGDEVADGHDYPAFLEHVFEEHGVTDVEVLNFGNSWYGFHQTFIVWNEIGRSFDCDVVLLGPDCFQPERDTTFNHTGLAYPYYLHARYVLDARDEHGAVRLVEVVGDTPTARFDAYLRFVPPLRYLRYDRNPPAALRALLPSARTVANPFYYDGRSAREEAEATYEDLLATMGRDAAPVLLAHSLPDVVAVAESAAARGGDVDLTAVWLPRIERFPYLAPGGHYSAFGNRWLASQYYALLTGAAEVDVIEFEDIASATGAAPAGAAAGPALSAYRSVDVRIDGHAVGVFAIASSDPSQRRGAADDLHGTRVAALVAVRAPGTALVDAAFVPLARAVEAGERVEVRVGRGAAARVIATSRIRSLAPAGNLAVADLDGIGFDGDLTLDLGGAAPSPADGAEVTLHVGADTVARGRVERTGVRLSPSVAELRSLRAVAGDYAEMHGPGSTGSLRLRLEGERGDVAEVTVARWTVRGVEATRLPVGVAPLVALSQGRARVRRR